MNDITFYFKEGLHHIISIDALDHQLFLLALTATYFLVDYKKLLVLITAFTIGHSITLALSVYSIINIQTAWVEFFIPCTIVITAAYNFFNPFSTTKKNLVKYFLAAIFGLIHGLGFANTLRFLLAKNQNFGWALASFNIGVEVGQIIIVILILLTSYLFVQVLKCPAKWWVYFLSGTSLLWAAKFAIERLP